MPLPAYTPLDRRPIASRKLGIWKHATTVLVSAGVSANAVSVVGMLCGVAAGAALAATARLPDAAMWLWLAGAALVQARLLCNMLDGMVAVQSGSASPVGELFNEVPDRVSDSAILIGLGLAPGGSLTLGFIAAILAMLTAYVRTVGRVAGAPQDYSGPMAKPHRMFVVTFVAIYMAFAPAGALPAWNGDHWGLPAAALALIIVGCAVTAARRLLRAAAVLRADPP